MRCGVPEFEAVVLLRRASSIAVSRAPTHWRTRWTSKCGKHRRTHAAKAPRRVQKRRTSFPCESRRPTWDQRESEKKWKAGESHGAVSAFLARHEWRGTGLASARHHEHRISHLRPIDSGLHRDCVLRLVEGRPEHAVWRGLLAASRTMRTGLGLLHAVVRESNLYDTSTVIRPGHREGRNGYGVAPSQRAPLGRMGFGTKVCPTSVAPERETTAITVPGAPGVGCAVVRYVAGAAAFFDDEGVRTRRPGPHLAAAGRARRERSPARCSRIEPA